MHVKKLLFERTCAVLILSQFVAVAFLAFSSSCAAGEVEVELFETAVRPILAEKCVSCHGPDEQSGGLRLDSRQAAIRGGSTAAAVVPGNPTKSLMLLAVQRTGELAMPPDDPLSAEQIKSIQLWIESGAAWPDYVLPLGGATQAAVKNHWAFQPVRRASLPKIANAAWPSTSVDTFILARLEEKQLTGSPPADRRTLIRRVTYALTGLPPTPSAVERFVQDASEEAYPQLVERLLASPQYGEHWARYWLDVARYSDTKGYVYAREERFWVHAWNYRDWVVEALNEDMPYNRFLLLQLAADQVENTDRENGDAKNSDAKNLAAMGFLTLGRRFLGVERDIIDDRIDVVCRGMMGLTLSCARCHDHKYDPIPTADYYSLYGVFDSCIENLVRLAPRTANTEFEAELSMRQQKLSDKLAEHRNRSAEHVRNRIDDYLFAQSELSKYPASGFDQVFQAEDLLPAFVRRWERFLRDSKKRQEPVFSAFHAYAELPSESFASGALEVTRSLQALAPSELNPIVSEVFEQPPESFRQVCDRYGELFARVKQQWEAACMAASEAGQGMPTELDDPHAEALRQMLYEPDAPCQVPAGPISHSEAYFDTDSCTELWKLQGEVDRWLIQTDVRAPYALTLVDTSRPIEPRIFRRGNPLNLGREVPRQLPAVLAGEDRQPFQQGSGRLELAHAIVDPANPLTARVLVNRIWAKHFGQGLVTTPSDFGTRASAPSHPQLLDWLASQFVEQGWSIKQLQRWIVMSSTFRQSSCGPLDAHRLAMAQQVDPGNRLLWRMNAQRLTFEEFRDSLLSATGELEPGVGGKPVELFTEPFPKRRTLYGLVDRQYLPGTLRMFDFANPDLHVPKRNETTVPQQALFFMNHPLVIQAARRLSERTAGLESRHRVAELFRRTLQRLPSTAEVETALALVHSAQHDMDPAADRSRTASDWQYGYGGLTQQSDRIIDFRPLPHFTGDAWQGGSNWPDSELGWVQLTAEGGHPGNDRSHAAIRRWTAPMAMIVNIRSRLRHEPAPGDGIRAFVVSSRQGILQSAVVHQDTRELNVDRIQLAQGESIDFLVDIGDVLNSDQFLWQVTIQSVGAHNETVKNWNSSLDFPENSVRKLEAWEQLAQVLLWSNEFLFVD